MQLDHAEACPFDVSITENWCDENIVSIELTSLTRAEVNTLIDIVACRGFDIVISFRPGKTGTRIENADSAEG